MANFTCLAAARDAALNGVGWDVRTRGLTGAPPIRVLVGAERHDTVDLALHYLGLGAPEPVAADEQGRLRTDGLAEALAADRDRPTIVCLQAGNVHSGDSDPFAAAVPLAKQAGAWVHVDGAFGLWAAASLRTRALTAGMSEADSWATDAHKTLNVPYDSGLAIVRDGATVRGAMSYHGDYLITDDTRLESYERVPESSRRARAIPVWAALRSLGRSGVAEMIDRFCRHARALADGARELPGVEVLNDVVFTQVCLSFGTDERTRDVGRRLMEDGTVWMSGSKWHGRDVLRISVSNWSTDEDDIARSLDALRRAAA
jgi:glutamate/tyrosine decarboxylase-like PLP-dependent enzyme